MKEYRLAAWPQLRAPFDRMAHRRMLSDMSQRHMTLAQLVECRLLYPPGHQDLWVIDAETRSISMHLAEMLAAGQVRMDANGVNRLA